MDKEPAKTVEGVGKILGDRPFLEEDSHFADDSHFAEDTHSVGEDTHSAGEDTHCAGEDKLEGSNLLEEGMVP